MTQHKMNWTALIGVVGVTAVLLLTIFSSPANQTAAAPAATVNLCTLPNARIDVDDFAYEGDDILVSGCQGEINGAHTFNSLTIQTGSTLVHSHTLTMALTIHTNVLIEAGSTLNLTGRGYAGGTAGYDPGDGPGGGQIGDGTGGGGGHGGFGGFRGTLFAQAGDAYGDPYRPTTIGSGGASCAANAFCSAPGGNGGNGGGAVHLDVAGTLTVEGSIFANGGSATQVSGVIPGSGGAGGSIWLEATTLSGSGQILADGGNGAGVRKIGGGGGRIAIYAANNSFSGDISAQGGQTELDPPNTGFDSAAGAGTIYLRDTDGSAGAMIIANRPLVNALLPTAATTPLDGGMVTPSAPHNFTTFDITGSALVAAGQPVAVTSGSAATPGLWAIQGRFEGVTTTLGSGVGLSVTSGTTETVGLQRTAFDGLLTMDASQDLRLDQGVWVELRESLAVDEVVVSGGSRLGHIAYRDGINPTLDLTANTLIIAAGSQINVGGRGYRGAPASTTCTAGGGPGGGGTGSLNGSGGGYGGMGGGFAGGITYGSATQPGDLGSGGSNGCGGGGSTLGAGGNGAGRVRLTVAGTVVLDGGIYANGGSGGDQQRDGGGGSGGSIWISANNLSGAGQISANGGTGHTTGGGGGGGRIFLDVVSNDFNGAITVTPGAGVSPQAGIGTIVPGDLFGVGQTAVPTPALIGQPITYTLQVRNNSTDPIMAAITHTLPFQTTPGGQQSWSATIPGGAVWTQDVTAVVDGSASGTLSSHLAATVNGVTRSSTLETALADAAIGGLTAVSDSPTLNTLPVNFTASVATGSGVSYSWAFGDGTTGTGPITDHVYPAPGVYIATVTASNSVNSLQATTTVTVTELPNFRGLVWHDLDGDGLQGAGEPGLGGATITANGPGGLLTDSSGVDGSWRIESAVGGLYTLDVDLPGYVPTTDPPPPLPLPDMGATVVDFGLAQPPAAGQGSIVGRAFADANGNGAADAGELGLSGVTIELLANGGVVDTAVTDGSGFYSFASASPGVYTLQANAPGGYYPLTLSTGELSLAAGQVQSALFGFLGAGTVGGSVSSGGGYPVAGATLILQEEGGAGVNTAVTNANGDYTFASVAPGVYQLRLLPPPEYLLSDGQDTRQIVVPSGGQATEDWLLLRQGRLRIRSYLAGVVPFVPIGNTAFIISPTTGIPLTVHTNGDGEAVVDGLDPGVYTLLPDLSNNPGDATVSPSQRQVTIGLDTSVVADFFLNFPRSIRFRCERWVSPSVPHGPAFPCLASATVVAGGAEPPGTVVATAQLNGERVGLFTDLPPGSYRITITPDPAVSGQAGWPAHEEVVVLGESDHREVAYPYNPTGGVVMIWGYAFYDRNQDGQRQAAANEANDSAANGLTVSLFTLDGTLVLTTTTQPNVIYGPGYYAFPDLAPDTYRVEIVLGTGQFATTPTSVQRVVNAISPPEEAIFGYIKQFNAAIAGKVFFDNDGNGQYSAASDDALGGLTVTLLDVGGAALDTRTTAANGTYSFYPLTTGEYTVVLTPPPGYENGTTRERATAVPDGNSSVTVDYALRPDDGKTRALVFLDQNFDGEPGTNERLAGVTVIRRYGGCPPIGGPTTDTAVSNADGLAQFATVLNTPICLSLDPASLPAGVVPAFGIDGDRIELMRASNSVWLRLLPAGVLTVHPFWDMDGDFNFDANEPVVSGAAVAIPGAGTVSSTAAGASFSLNAGSYAVTVTPPNGMSVTIVQPQTASVSNGGASTLAIPLRYLGQINGSVTAVGGNPPWANVTVILENVNSGAVQLATVATSSGYFAFNNAAPGTFRLRLLQTPPGWALASEPVFVYTAGGTVTQPLSLVRLGSVAGLVYTDANGNGVKNSNEAVNGNYDVTLINSAGQAVQTVNVAADGTFAFANLVPGAQYAVTLDLGGGQFGAPGVAITQNPGWFTVGSTGLDVRIGLYPYPWSPSSSVNTVYGRVYEQVGAVKNPHAGAVLGYRRWSDNGRCDNNNPIEATTTSDVDGYYRLLTDFIPSTWEFYCIVLLDLPGMVQNNPEILTSSTYYYQSTSGMVYYAGVELRDVVVAPTGSSARATIDAGQVSWLAFRDDNGNGWRDGDEPALPGAILSSGAVQGSSGADGSGTLTGLASGEQVLTITPPEGYAMVGPAERRVWLGDTAVALGPIGFRPDGWLVGSVFVDEDGDSRRAPDESGLGGVSLTLSGPAVTSTVTAPDGSIVMAGLPDGSYAVTVVTPSGFVAPPATSITLADGGTLNLGLPPDGHVSGAVYEDWDGDGLRLADEPLLVFPVTMTLAAGARDWGLGTGNWVLSQISSLQSPISTTLRAGKFLFWNVAAGNYEVDSLYGAVMGTAVSPQSGGGVALGAVPGGVVRGTVWHDADGDGRRQPWEAPLSGVAVTLAGETVVTDENGRFAFYGLAPGSYALDVVLPDGLTANTPPVVVVTAVRGAVVGITAVAQEGFAVYLPAVVR